MPTTLPPVLTAFARALAAYTAQLDEAERCYDAMPAEYDDDNAYEWVPFRTACETIDCVAPQTARVKAFHASLYARAAKEYWPAAAFSALHALEFDLHERCRNLQAACVSPAQRALQHALALAEARAEGGQ